MHAIDQNPPKQKRPVFGMLSILFPLLGVLCGVIQARFATGNGEGWAEVSAFVHTFVVSILLGFITVVFSFLRLEKYRFLPVIGLILDVAPVVWFVFH
jgi:hypothetical protein